MAFRDLIRNKKPSRASNASGEGSPPDRAEPSKAEESSLARQSADGAKNVLVGGRSVDRGGVDVFVPGDSLSQSDVPGSAVDVRESGMPEVMESELPVEHGALLPAGEGVAESADTEPSSLARDEDGGVRSEGLTPVPLPPDELSELVDESVREEDGLIPDGGTAPVLEDSEVDAPLDEPLPVTRREQIANVERDNLELAKSSPKSDREDDVIAESISMLSGDPEEQGLLGPGKNDGGSSGVRVAHNPVPPGVSETIPKEDKSSNSKKRKYGHAPLAIVKKNEQEFRDWLATEVGFLACFSRFDDEKPKFEPYQLEFLATDASYRCVEKSRQVGYSWIFACEAIARAHLRPNHNSIFVSYNLADSKEKIAYAAQLHEELPLKYQKKKVIDSKLELGFRSNDANKRISRIISHPSRAPRGKKGDIYLDEIAHYANDREVYKGSTALILRSRGQLTVCSSPLGRRGMFWEIARQEMRPYDTYWRQKVPWWLCSFFCTDVFKAAIDAPKMSTKDRVERFGTQGIKEQYGSMPLEDFQQEFEVAYVDESMAFFPYDLILPCTNDELELAKDFTQVRVKGRLTAGFDVGRKKDLSELAIFDELDNGTKTCRGLWRWEKARFDTQENAIRLALETLPIAKLRIDQNGIGMHLAENLETDYPEIVEPFTFSGNSKEVLCNDFKIGLQHRRITLPSDRELIGQIHSIRKKVTAAGRTIYESIDSEGKGHADRFWACALACMKERTVAHVPDEVSVRIIQG